MTKTETPGTHKKPRSWPWIVLLVLAVSLTNFLSGESLRTPPGELRGDIRLAKDDLPQEIDNWELVRFIPPDTKEHFRDGQWWWSHQWIYKKGDATAIVSLDQLGWNQWHELTACYAALTGRL